MAGHYPSNRVGLLVGAGALAALGLTRVLDMRVGEGEVTLIGHQVPSWVSLGQLVLIAAALAYVLGILAARQLGSTMASFVGLTEVLFAILFAWILLGELPRAIQLLGGALILAGVVAVRLGERAREAADPSQDTAEDLYEHAETPAP